MHHDRPKRMLRCTKHGENTKYKYKIENLVCFKNEDTDSVEHKAEKARAERQNSKTVKTVNLRR